MMARTPATVNAADASMLTILRVRHRTPLDARVHCLGDPTVDGQWECSDDVAAHRQSIPLTTCVVRSDTADKWS